MGVDRMLATLDLMDHGNVVTSKYLADKVRRKNGYLLCIGARLLWPQGVFQTKKKTKREGTRTRSDCLVNK